MREIFIYMFKMEHFKRNTILLFGLIFISVLLFNLTIMFSPQNMFGKFSPFFIIFFIADLIALTLPCGYAVSLSQNIMDKENKFPDFDLKKNFITGAKFLVSFICLFFVVGFIYLILGFVNNFFITHNLIPLAFIVSAFSFLISFIVSFMLIAALYNFTKTNDILSFINYPSLTKLINKNVNNYFKYYIVFVLLMFLILFINNYFYFRLNFLGYLGLFLYTTFLSIIFTYITQLLTKITINSIKE